MYGLGAEALAYKHGISVSEACALQAIVPRIYPVFDAWLKRVLNKARMGRTIMPRWVGQSKSRVLTIGAEPILIFRCKPMVLR